MVDDDRRDYPGPGANGDPEGTEQESRPPRGSASHLKPESELDPGMDHELNLKEPEFKFDGTNRHSPTGGAPPGG